MFSVVPSIALILEFQIVHKALTNAENGLEWVGGLQQARKQLSAPCFLTGAFVKTELQQNVEILCIDIVLSGRRWRSASSFNSLRKGSEWLEETDWTSFSDGWLQFESQTLSKVKFIKADVCLSAELFDEVEGKFLYNLLLTAEKLPQKVGVIWHNTSQFSISLPIQLLSVFLSLINMSQALTSKRLSKYMVVELQGQSIELNTRLLLQEQ